MRTMLGRVTCAVVLLMCVGMPGCRASGGPPDAGRLRAEFGVRYRRWMVALDLWIQRNAFRSDTAILPEERQIAAMGLRSVPFIIEVLEDDLRMTALDEWIRANTLRPDAVVPVEERLDVWMGPRAATFTIEQVLEADLRANSLRIDNRLRSRVLGMLWVITAKRFPMNEWPPGSTYGDQRTEERLYIGWWRHGRRRSARQFDRLYSELDRLPAGADGRMQELLDRIRSLGLEALPQIVQKVKQGDERLLPMVRIMIRFAGVREDEFVVDGRDTWSSATLLRWWKVNKERLTFPDPPAEAAKH